MKYYHIPLWILLTALYPFAIIPHAQADEPRIVREEIEWLDVWIPGNSNAELPKVLLIGDSITRSYYKTVETAMKGQAVVCRLTTSKSLGDPAFLLEVKLVLSQAKFAVVHFNNGLHGWGYTEAEYGQALPELLSTIREAAPGAKLVWANTTPVRVADKTTSLSDKTQRVRKRNEIAAKVMADAKIPVNDLFELAIDQPEWYSRDGVHFNAKGIAALGEQVAKKLPIGESK